MLQKIVEAIPGAKAKAEKEKTQADLHDAVAKARAAIDAALEKKRRREVAHAGDTSEDI